MTRNKTESISTSTFYRKW